MTDQPFDPEQQFADVMRQAGELTRTLMSQHTESVLSRRRYERVPWDKVNQLAAEGWQLTAVMSDGMHVMQREISPAEQVTDALAQITGGRAGMQ